MRGLANIAREAGDGCLRVTVDQNLVLGFVQLAFLPRVYAALKAIDLGERRARIAGRDHCPGAYSCNLALTKSMNLGDAMDELVRKYDDPLRASCRSISAAAPIPAASTGRRKSASTATPARSTARKSRTTRCCSAAVTTNRA